MVDKEQDSGFLKRWSRRKQQIADDETKLPDNAQARDLPVAETLPAVIDAPSPETTEQDQTTEQDLEEASASETPVLSDEDMPPIESLDKDSDYSPFLSEGVSKELRNMALKKLFFSGKFALRDGLDDYDDDFTKFEPLGNTVTSDMKFHQRRKERERLAKLEEEQKALEENAQNQENAQNEKQAQNDEALPVEEEASAVEDKEAQAESTEPADTTEPESAVDDDELHQPPRLTAVETTPHGDSLAGGKLQRVSATTTDSAAPDKGENA